jgi:protein-tyrosine phosphatase
VVSLVTDAEMEYYGAVGLRRALQAANLRSLQFPIEDTQPPKDMAATQALCLNILRWLGEGENVLIHCIGGWGRSGTIAAALLTHQGYDAETAIDLVRQARSARCVESRAQERFVREYARKLGQAARAPRSDTRGY